MPNAPASDEAVAFALATEDVSFGVHLTFVGDGDERTAAPPGEVPALVDRRGRLHRTNRVRLGALVGRLPIDQIEREIAAQLEWARSRGVDVAHVDSHRHLHKYAPFREALARVLPKFGVRRVRNVQDVYLHRPLISPTVWFGARWRAELMRRFATTDHFYMPATTGDGSWAALLQRSELADSTMEIGVHPGEVDDWRRREVLGLAEFARIAHAGGHRLVTWNEV
jgi:predicted glycoside hydrolase/deacetylase ChbG (UPF0249 family)